MQSALSKFGESFNLIVKVARWYFKDPLIPSWALALCTSIVLVASQYSSFMVIFILTKLFFPDREIILPLDAQKFIPEYIFESSNVWMVSFIVFFILFSQSIIVFLCRRFFVNQSTIYYKKNIQRAAEFYISPQKWSNSKNTKNINLDMMIMFSVGSARYLANAYLSFINSLTSMGTITVATIALLAISWQMTILLFISLILFLLIQLPIIHKGVGLSKIILSSSTELVKQTRQEMEQRILTPQFKTVDALGVPETIVQLEGTQNFVGSLQNRMILSFKSQMFGQLGVAIVLLLLLLFVQLATRQEWISQASGFSFVVLSIPLGAGVIALMRAIVGVVSSSPYFIDYINVFSQNSDNNSATEQTETSQGNYTIPDGFLWVYAPIGLELNWSSVKTICLSLSGAHNGAKLKDLDSIKIIRPHAHFTPWIGKALEHINGHTSDHETLARFEKPFQSTFVEIKKHCIADNISDFNADAFDNFPAHLRIFLELLESYASDQVIVMSYREYRALPERLRVALKQNLSEQPIFIFADSASKTDISPKISHSLFVFGDGTITLHEAQEDDGDKADLLKRLSDHSMLYVSQNQTQLHEI